MADALGSGPSESNLMQVQLLLSAPRNKNLNRFGLDCLLFEKATGYIRGFYFDGLICFDGLDCLFVISKNL